MKMQITGQGSPILLPNRKFGDTDNISFRNLIVRKDTNQYIRFFASDWHGNNTYSFITWLYKCHQTFTKIDRFEEFLIDNNGLLVTVNFMDGDDIVCSIQGYLYLNDVAEQKNYFIANITLVQEF